jgi:hypothetical protein
MAQPSRETPEQQGGVLLLIDAQADLTPLFRFSVSLWAMR